MAIRPNYDNLTFLGRAQDFIDTYNFDPELVKDVVRFPERRPERDEHSVKVGHPVYRFKRGDITVVVGFADPEFPTILHVWLHWPDDGEGYSKQVSSGGGPAKKTPTSVTQMRGWLQAEGCRLEWSSTKQRVTYNDVFVGVLHLTPHTSGASLKNTYMSFRRKLAVIKAESKIRDGVNAIRLQQTKENQ